MLCTPVDHVRHLRRFVHLEQLHPQRLDDAKYRLPECKLDEIVLVEATAWTQEDQEWNLVGDGERAERVERVAESGTLQQQRTTRPSQICPGQQSDALFFAGQCDDPERGISLAKA